MKQLKIAKQVTSRDTPSLDKYLQEISRLELLSVEEEVHLAKLIQGGDEVALDRLISANLRFVISVAKQYQNQGITLPDLINEGNVGLIKAAKRFDDTRGFKFISYAVWWIRQSILQALAEQSRIIRLPLNKIGSLNRINRTFALLEQRFEREPSEEEIADSLEIAPEEVKDALRHFSRTVSIDLPIGEDEDVTLEDILIPVDAEAPDSLLIKESLKNEINRAIARLSNREAFVLKRFYGLNDQDAVSLEEIADELDLTRERVRQIRERAIKRLKNNSQSAFLKYYLAD
jgi:RNA polymerase primary sigma factor